ncbi:hypothetical protein J2T19_004709 [Paenibacillus tundrae]|uniref:Uncharacterized protein n=1 Tax=Paenibacillus tundrae TaxID=528187 RepID=A0ABT9WIX0_9BACL|nr:hypothetical protein [Paenibacillus tundrae]
MRSIVNALKMTHAAAGIPQQHGDQMRMIIIFVLMQLFLPKPTFSYYMPVIEICKWGFSQFFHEKNKKPPIHKDGDLSLFFCIRGQMRHISLSGFQQISSSYIQHEQLNFTRTYTLTLACWLAWIACSRSYKIS